MLVLSRQVEETVVIVCPNGDRLTVALVDIRGNQAKVGFEAPREYAINRGEVQEIIDRKTASA